ncbi:MULTISPECIES: twin-arginine translocation pathway signal protein [Rhodopseudomonas]|nr:MULTISPECIES: twin-arginine translocation pathway signal protein [Rhodopseudomonas]MDF3810364.1 twin-arginine translocation pathway signal protein [Rhodopseudomonas sp. BAL398]WOK19987.1 twin-arginine translocation pathway signal protein [Rhodopseudomonas sp. BAL398]
MEFEPRKRAGALTGADIVDALALTAVALLLMPVVGFVMLLVG